MFWYCNPYTIYLVIFLSSFLWGRVGAYLKEGANSSIYDGTMIFLMIFCQESTLVLLITAR